MRDFTHYADLKNDDLILERIRVGTNLANLHEEYAMVLSQEKDEKIKAWVTEDPGSSIAARDRAAEYAARIYTTEIIELKGRIAAYTEEKDLLDLLLERS